MKIVQEQVTRAFGVLFHSLLRAASGDVQRVTITPDVLTNYASRVFGEPPSRVMAVVSILEEMDMVEQKDKTLVFYCPNEIEEFFEYYQYYWYRESFRESLHLDQDVMDMLQTLLHFKGTDPDEGLKIDFHQLCAEFQNKFERAAPKDVWSKLINRGLNIKKTRQNGKLQLHMNCSEVERLKQINAILLKIQDHNKTVTQNVAS